MRLVHCVGVVALALAAQAQVFPVSDARCPAAPRPAPGVACGIDTFRYCDTPSATCPFCLPSSPLLQTGKLPPTTKYGDSPKDYVVDLEDYAFYHLLNLEYLVEFSKRPMPFQKPVSLPYCGLPSLEVHKRKLEERKCKKLLGCGKIIPDKIGGTLGQIGEGLKKVEKEVEKGLGSILTPFLDKPPKVPKLIPRPVCIPKTLVIPVHFTVFATNLTTAWRVDSTSLEQQINVTNTAFAPLNITFFIASINYHVGLQWNRFTKNKNPGDADYYAYSQGVKAANRYGGNDEVNVWVVESIDEVNCTTGVLTYGYCSMARNLAHKNHNVDGCAITIDSLPGVSFRGGPGTGNTLTHELGHFFDLPHVFPEATGAGCEGESDDIGDTFQFPNNDDMFKPQQPRCCSTGAGAKKKWAACADKTPINVTNYMSYSEQAGHFNPGDDPGTMPWTTEQRAHIFAAFYTLRRAPPPGGIDCNTYPVWFEAPPSLTAREFGVLKKKREGGIQKRDFRGANLLRQGDRLLEQLKKLCAAPADANTPQAIDIGSGEVVACDEDGTCAAPSTGARCPDGSAPPCTLQAYCSDGSTPPCDGVLMCPDGSAPPCVTDVGSTGTCPGTVDRVGGGGLCPDGTAPTCPKVSSPPDPKEKDPNKDPNDPKEKDPKKDPKEDPNTPGGTCPAGCDIHSNKCDATTAPTCTFPDPRVAKPRAACACRPGFKATGHTDGDAAAQWRLPVAGQEHRVWVAEGVVCDSLCVVSGGVDSCKEVTLLQAACVSYP
ncbi:hypothetical protein B0T24DRAFT_109093 [Lasiosphaeria ovina]|uniref:Peptidase M43 pregnancy-associated plasma-A domain-containing protein n=1 Tax=Lasiosphaeria ovina TaxID=92902 RepID=A0AAE0JUL3_9PEZI|nr:hypothetical protein B0T24DRAFT_109093 [Lasiosphaeria ovina]